MNLKVAWSTAIGVGAIALAGTTYVAAGSLIGHDPPTTVELQAAAEEYASCGEAAGFTSAIVNGEGKRPPVVSFTIPEPSGTPSQATSRQAEEALQRCRASYDAADTARAASATNPTLEELGAMHERLRTCMQTGGRPDQPVPAAMIYGRYEASPPLSFTVSREEKLAYKQCAMAEQAASGLLAPPPD